MAHIQQGEGMKQNICGMPIQNMKKTTLKIKGLTHTSGIFSQRYGMTVFI